MRKRAGSIKLRKEAFERDSGICAACSADCEKIKRVFWAILDFDAQCFYGELLASDGQVFWEADHVIEVAANGSDSPRNIQTLCVACHKDKTAGFMRTRLTAPRLLLPCAEGCDDRNHGWLIYDRMVEMGMYFAKIENRVHYRGPRDVGSLFHNTIQPCIRNHIYPFAAVVETVTGASVEAPMSC